MIRAIRFAFWNPDQRQIKRVTFEQVERFRLASKRDRNVFHKFMKLALGRFSLPLFNVFQIHFAHNDYMTLEIAWICKSWISGQSCSKTPRDPRPRGKRSLRGTDGKRLEARSATPSRYGRFGSDEQGGSRLHTSRRHRQEDREVEDIYGTLSRLAEKRTAKSPKAFQNPKSEISFGKRWVESR
jgi:hypothetical protein